MRALNAAQINADLALELGIDRLRQVMAHQNVFGRNGAVGFELKDPMPIRLLPLKQRTGRGLNVLFQCARVGARHPVRSACVNELWVMSSAARWPDRMALSIVAGKPVFVQSPAKARLR